MENPKSSATQVRPTTPYRGLEPFHFADRRIFFERQDVIQSLFGLVLIRRAVLLFGESGTGKSSLINAGLIPEIIKEGLMPLRIRIGNHINSEIILDQFHVGDSEVPILGGSAIFQEIKPDNPLVLTCNDFEQRIRDDNGKETALLVFDQFEEFITIAEEARGATEYPECKEVQSHILGMIVRFIEDQYLRIKLLFVFREEYLARFSDLFARSPRLLEEYIRLTSPDERSLENIVRGPLQALDEDGRALFEKSMPGCVVEELIQQFRMRYKRSRLNLSEIQVACLRLWESDNPIKLLKVRGIDGLLEDYLSEALNPLSANLRHSAISILTKLVTSSGTRNIATEEHIFALVNAEESVANESLEIALHHLVSKTRLVRKELRRTVYFFEIVSEFLVPWIVAKQKERLDAIKRKRLRRRIALVLLSITAVIVAVCVSIVFYDKSSEYQVALRTKIVMSAKRSEDLARIERDRLKTDLKETRDGNNALAQKSATMSERITALQDAYDAAPKQAEVDELKNRLARELLVADTANKINANEILRLKLANSDLLSQNMRLESEAARAPKHNIVSPEKKYRDETADIVVYAIHSLPKHTPWHPKIYLDNLPYGYISGGTYLSLRVDSGMHTICIADADTRDQCAYASVTVASHDTAYVRVLLDSTGKKFTPTLNGAGKQDQMRLAPRPIPSKDLITQPQSHVKIQD